MVDRNLAPSRSRAADAVSRGVVFVDGSKAIKPSQKVPPSADITLCDPAAGYVSRAALKLTAALDAFSFSPKSLKLLDIGASTGGFTQVLLERGAHHVFAVDVGHNQLHKLIQQDQRVTNLEGVNARTLRLDDIGEKVEALVCDVSFISLKLALPPCLSLVATGGWAALLVKPQFEVGREAVGKGGIVRSPEIARQAVDDIATWLDAMPCWSVKGVIACPIKGSDGNLEYMLGATFDG